MYTLIFISFKCIWTSKIGREVSEVRNCVLHCCELLIMDAVCWSECQSWAECWWPCLWWSWPFQPKRSLRLEYGQQHRPGDWTTEEACVSVWAASQLALQRAIASNGWATTGSSASRAPATTHVSQTSMTCCGGHSAANGLRMCWGAYWHP